MTITKPVNQRKSSHSCCTEKDCEFHGINFTVVWCGFLAFIFIIQVIFIIIQDVSSRDYREHENKHK